MIPDDERIVVSIAIFSRAYRNMAQAQHADGLVNHPGDILVDNTILRKGRVYMLRATDEVRDLIRRGVLQDVRHTVFGPGRRACAQSRT